MRLRTSFSVIAAGLAFTMFADAASAACTRLGFSVNDYGKDGPTKDAKGLLDKYIAKWAAERGIKKFTTGKKEVTCELFLDLIVFDEHTCRAEAPVCWDGKMPADAVAAGNAAPSPAAKPKSKAAAKAAAASVPVTTGSIPVAKPAVVEAAPVPAAVAATPVNAAPDPAMTVPATAPPVEAPKAE